MASDLAHSHHVKFTHNHTLVNDPVQVGHNFPQSSIGFKLVLHYANIEVTKVYFHNPFGFWEEHQGGRGFGRSEINHHPAHNKLRSNVVRSNVVSEKLQSTGTMTLSQNMDTDSLEMNIVQGQSPVDQ